MEATPHINDGDRATDKKMERQIEICAHDQELAIFCQAHDMALCNDCYFSEHGTCGKGMTLKQAASTQISQYETILAQCAEAVESCSDMQYRMMRQEGLEEEVLKKVNKQYDQLKAIVDEQKLEAHNIIKHLESVQEYKPPPKDFTSETLTELKAFQAEIQDKIQKQRQLS